MTSHPSHAAVSRTLPAITVVAVALTGCAAGHTTQAQAPPTHSTPHSPSPTTPGAPKACGTPGRPIPVADPHNVDHRNPTAVGCAALVLQWHLDTITDTAQQTQHAGELRLAASDYVTDDYAAQLRHQRPIPLPGGIWQRWEHHRAYLAVHLTLGAETDDAPADTTTTAYRQWKITTVPTGRDDWHGDPVTHIAFVELVRTGSSAPWHVANARYA